MKNIYVLTGMSGVGKTSVINKILKTGSFCYPQMYTTRPIKEHIIDGKIHLDEESYVKLQNKAVEFIYNYHKYAITDIEVRKANIFDLAPSGFRSLKENYFGDKKIIIIYVWIEESERIKRMKERGETDENIFSRLQYEKIEYQNIEEEADYIIKNDNFENCVNKILSIIALNEHTEYNQMFPEL
ncbi:MAG: hypothetical protein NC305_06395 [Lachnospiraceae bacterium]|nr:hypothetical protein [Lachnospiraceae bacterium]